MNCVSNINGQTGNWKEALGETTAASKNTHRHSRNEGTDEVVVSTRMTAHAKLLWCVILYGVCYGLLGKKVKHTDAAAIV